MATYHPFAPLQLAAEMVTYGITFLAVHSFGLARSRE
jgi:hypothetical protein